MKIQFNLLGLLFPFLAVLLIQGCKSKQQAPPKEPIRLQIIETNITGIGQALEIRFEKGPEHNHPLMAIWLEDTSGNYIQTLYVAKSIATSTFEFGQVDKGKWMPGVICRPAALPYWAHKRGIKTEDGCYMPTVDNPVPDAYTGATPQAGFILKTRTDKHISGSVKLMLEINQSWDWNEYWTNNKFPDDKEYKTSSQPALVYEAIIDTERKGKEYILRPVGHSHYSGKNGELYTDLSTLTTALKIAAAIQVTVL